MTNLGQATHTKISGVYVIKKCCLKTYLGQLMQFKISCEYTAIKR